MNPRCPRRLIVEGKDDCHSIIHLTKRHGINWDDPQSGVPYVDPAGGVTEALEAIEVGTKTYERLGVVVDADCDVESRWTAVRDRFKAAGIALPANPDPDGTIVTSGGKRFGVWLMPANNTAGKLEDFLATLVPQADPCWTLAGTSAASALANGATFAPADKIKAHVHTWLAWQEEPGRALGTAITSCYFTHDSPEALAFVAWFSKLFIE